MIKVYRPPLAYPDKLAAQIQESLKDLAKFFGRTATSRIQRNPPFRPILLRQIKKPLTDIFAGKCAYCESPLVGAGVTELFRPGAGAIGLDGKKSPKHYWWLAYEWNNLYLSCQRCNYTKGNKFPVDGQRGAEGEPLYELWVREHQLLIDPCQDDPADHLEFSEDGSVYPRTPEGEITIDVIALNRQDLVEARRKDVSNVIRMAKSFINSGAFEPEWAIDLMRKDEPYTAARIQCLMPVLAEALNKRSFARIERAVKKNLGLGHGSVMSSSSFLAPKIRRTRKKKEEASISSKVGRQLLHSKNYFIRKVHIKNFRRIEELILELSPPSDGTKPWAMLIGENGMGKSSVLKAIALALMDDPQRELLGLKAKDFVRRGEDSGFVEIFVEGYSRPFRLDFKAGESHFESNNVSLQSLLFCYGGTRLLPTRRSRNATGDSFSRTGNLFDPFCPLINAQKWLLGLNDVQFEYSAKAIKNLFTKNDQRMLVRTPSEKPKVIGLVSDASDRPDPIQVLSDGYQSIIALVADILEISFRHFTDASDAQGIVLVDEIDVHLHPRWKIEIVKLLRRVFPRMQFLLTTHDPLCLVGTQPGEVHLLTKHEQTGSVVCTRRDVPPGISPDQLLTGFWFGLPSTLDDDTIGLLNQHRQALRKEMTKGGPTATDLSKRRSIENKLRVRLGSFGDTSLERMAQSVVAELVNEDLKGFDFTRRDEIRKTLRRKLKHKMQQIKDGPNAKV